MKNKCIDRLTFPVSKEILITILIVTFLNCINFLTGQSKNIIAPPDVVVSCSYVFDLKKLLDTSDATFGRIQSNWSSRKKVVIQDIVCHKFCEKNLKTGYPGYYASSMIPTPASIQACNFYNTYFDTAHALRKYELPWGFDGYLNGPAGSYPTIKVNDLRQCGMGKIERIFYASGSNLPFDSAVQTIWIVDCDPFFVDTLHCNDSLYSDVIWPDGVCNKKIIKLDCNSTIPNTLNLGPRIIHRSNSNCSQTTIDYFDQFTTNVSNNCLQLNRKWVVIDWCQYDPLANPNLGRWEATQIIEISDTIAPVLKLQIGKQEAVDLNGVAFLHITCEAMDNCTVGEFLFVDYKIDEQNDGLGKYPGGFDYQVGPINLHDIKKGIKPLINDNKRALDPNNSTDASGSYPIGIHKIFWTVVDGCGNAFSRTEFFEIKNILRANDLAETKSGFVLYPNPSNGNVEILSPIDMDRVCLRTITGQMIELHEISATKKFELKNLSAGLYYVQASGNGQWMSTKKLLILD